MDATLEIRNVIDFIISVSSAIGLKCYECLGNEDTCSKSTLEKNKDTKLFDCGSSSTKRCSRLWKKTDTNTTVFSECSNVEDCEAVKRGCDDFKDKFDNYDCAIGCCDTDACNAGSAVSTSVFLLIVSSVVGLALMM